MANRKSDGLDAKVPPIGLLVVDLHFPNAQSLKEKRMVVRGLKARLRDRFSVSVAETGYQALWQRAQVAAVAVSSERRGLESILESMARDIEDRYASELVELRIEVIG